MFTTPLDEGRQEIGEERMEEILRELDATAAFLHRLDELLIRLAASGLYQAIVFDEPNRTYVFVRRDGSRIGLSPEALVNLFTIRPRPRAVA
jgi:hypothetical protein